MTPGPRNLLTDVPGLLVGNASDPRLKSGVTVVLGEKPVTAGVHVMGGAPGTRETELLAPDRLVSEVDAIVLSGGSAFGLDAASGVADALRLQGRGFAVGPARVPIVPAAILFDLLNGGDKDWPQNPYRALGEQALSAASTDFALGTAGAGAGATTATLKGGLGSASIRLESGITVAALAAVNAHLGAGTADVTNGPAHNPAGNHTLASCNFPMRPFRTSSQASRKRDELRCCVPVCNTIPLCCTAPTSRRPSSMVSVSGFFPKAPS